MSSNFAASKASNERHRLDHANIIETADSLSRRLSDKLPGSTLAGLAVELARIARATEERARQARRPIFTIRAASALAIIACLAALWYLVRHIHARWEFGTVTELFDATDAGFNLLVILGGVLWFFVSLERRIKRKKALAFLEELREFVHVVDATQLFFTPEIYKLEPVDSRTPFSLDYTYLLFCTQMLGVISNLAPLYSRGTAGDSIMRAAFEVETLANSISAKLFNKTDAVRSMANIE
jgi:hypothetical protein